MQSYVSMRVAVDLQAVLTLLQSVAAEVHPSGNTPLELTEAFINAWETLLQTRKQRGFSEDRTEAVEDTIDLLLQFQHLREFMAVMEAGLQDNLEQSGVRIVHAENLATEDDTPDAQNIAAIIAEDFLKHAP